VVLDGMGDLPIAQLGNKTPLEAAHKPNLDALAARGSQGTMSTIGPDIAPESDAAVMSLLGYDVAQYYTGRGPLEACGAGVEVRDGDLAWRCNFATVDGNWNIIDRRVGRNLEDADARELAMAVQQRVHLSEASFQFEHTTGHRACLVIRAVGGALSGQVDNGDPGYAREGPYSVALAEPGTIAERTVPLDDSDAARHGTDLTNSFLEQSHEILDGHLINQRRRSKGQMPANFVLVRDAGDRLPRLPHFRERFGLNFGAVVEMPVEKGLAMLTAMEEVPIHLPTGDLATDLTDWADQAAEGLAELDGLYVHLKASDVPGHDGDYRLKRDIISAIDSYFFGRLERLLDSAGLTVCVTADHSTPCALRAHSADPVPVLVAGGVEADRAGSFGERNAAGGDLGYFIGPQLMPRLVEIAQGNAQDEAGLDSTPMGGPRESQFAG
jgi:2,3-bisphosphoglycerate-independent phosphoglycerate mutase